MEIVILGMTVLSILYVGMPLFRKSRKKLGVFRTFYPDRRFQLEEKKRAAYSAIKELEFDFHMGKLTKEDYSELRSHYEKDAIEVLKQLDKSSPLEDLEEKVEEEISNYLERKKRKIINHFCPHCGNEVKSQDCFCSKCGTKLRREVS